MPDAKVPAADIARIEQAAPARPFATPRRPRRMLMVTAAPMYYHDVIPWGAEAVAILGRKTGAFDVTLDNDPAAFARENLAKFDAICFNNTCGELFDDAGLKQNIADFVAAGGGYVGIHCAAHTFLEWKEFGLINGAYSRSHPWVSETVTVKVEDGEHPVARPLGRSFQIVDEIYEFYEDPYSRKRLHILASIDTARTDMNKAEIQRTDNDFALAWVHSYGKGRAFFSAFGHYKEVFWNPAMLAHYLAGMQFALGDLPADTTPSVQ